MNLSRFSINDVVVVDYKRDVKLGMESYANVDNIPQGTVGIVQEESTCPYVETKYRDSNCSYAFLEQNLTKIGVL